MKIGYFADGPWSHKAIETLVAEGYEICFITPRFDTQDPVLKDWAEKLDVPFLISENVNDPEFIKLLHEYNPDLLISMSFNQILRSDIINFAPLGFINCHAGKLPFYRGRNPLNWAIINDEKSIGVTVHFIDEGIDTGDIVTQLEVPILESDNYGTLLDKTIDACPKALLDAVTKLNSGDYERIIQTDIDPIGTYFGRRVVGDEVIDWKLSSRRLHNFIRAITIPGPCARTTLPNGDELAIVESTEIKGAPSYIATTGEVIGRCEDGVVLKTSDTTLLVKKVALVLGDGTLGAIHTPKYRIGTRFQ